jgi:predicted nucleic acid-binding protein
LSIDVATSPVVVDASVTISWCIADEANEHTDRLLLAASRRGIVVPVIWWLEVTNIMSLGRLRARVSQEDWDDFENTMAKFNVETDQFDSSRIVNDVARLSHDFRLTVCDACYLELAIRRKCPLMTGDRKLLGASITMGVSFQEF